jgi:two-component system phosphate regulon sensor histidine kinase PhoR
MDLKGSHLIEFLLGVEAVQLGVFWMFVRRRYQLSLRQLARLAGDIAVGKKPGSYYVDGPPAVVQLAQHLESIGTQLEDLQRRRQEEEFNLNVLLANMVEGVMVVDRRHVVRLANDELSSLFDLKASPLNRTVLESLREARVELIVRETLNKGEPQREEVVLQSAAGNPIRQFDVSAVPIRTDTGEIGGAVVVFHDITRIKHLELMRSEFVANVSHELRTPLSIFRGYLETLRDHPDLPPPESRRMVDAMGRHSERLNALVEDLLALTRFEAKQVRIEPQVIRLDAFLRQLLHDWEHRAGAEPCTVELAIPADLPGLEVDPLRFEQVILNLLENAVAYSNPPRRIVISAGCREGWMELRVADNGMGIPPADLPRIFERFYRVDKGRSRVSGGTGLGLSIVRSIIQSHGGEVDVESEVGQGTTIRLRLPLNRETGQEPFSLAERPPGS